jgi:hypothetical protein
MEPLRGIGAAVEDGDTMLPNGVARSRGVDRVPSDDHPGRRSGGSTRDNQGFPDGIASSHGIMPGTEASSVRFLTPGTTKPPISPPPGWSRPEPRRRHPDHKVNGIDVPD